MSLLNRSYNASKFRLRQDSVSGLWPTPNYSVVPLVCALLSLIIHEVRLSMSIKGTEDLVENEIFRLR